MMDVLMLLIFAASFGLLALLVHWCQKQLEHND